MAKKKNRYAGLTNDQVIAAAEGDVQYGPQLAQIRDLYTDAAKQRVSDINSARQTAQSSVAFSRAQRPTVKAVYARGSSQADKTAADVNAAFGKLGPNNPYSAEIAAEQGGMKNRIEEARIGALQELTNRATGAQAGKALAINQARASYRENKSTLDQKVSDLLGQRGSFIEGRLATLGNEAANRQNERANRQNKLDVAKVGAHAGDNKVITAAGAYQGKTPAWVKNHPQQAQALTDAWNKAHPAGGGSGGRTGGRTGGQVKDAGNFSDQVNAAMRFARGLKKDGSKADRHAVADILLSGQTIPTGGNQHDRIPKFGQLAASVALDMVYDRHLSRQNAAALHKRNVKVSDLNNVVSYTNWLPDEQRRQAQARAKARADARARRNRAGTVFGANPFTGAPM